MPAPSGNKTFAGGVAARIRDLGLALPSSPAPLGAYVESSDTGNLLFLTGMLPVVKPQTGHHGPPRQGFTVAEGQEAARIAALNALAVAKEHLGGFDRLKKLVKLTVLMAATDAFTDLAPVADGASNLFVQIFGPEVGHTRLVYGVLSLPIGAPVIIDTIFEIDPAPIS